MKKSLKHIFLTVIAFALGIFTTNTITPAFAIGDVCNSSAANEVKEAAGCHGTKDDLKNVIINVINGVVGMLALVAVVFVIIGGVQYMTSTGDSGKTKKAKDTILYALIGLAVCALAFVIVNFVIVNILGNN